MIIEKLSLDLTGEDYDLTLQLAQRAGTTPGAVLAEALGTFRWILDQQDTGVVFHAMSEDGTDETVQFQ